MGDIYKEDYTHEDYQDVLELHDQSGSEQLLNLSSKIESLIASIKKSVKEFLPEFEVCSVLFLVCMFNDLTGDCISYKNCFSVVTLQIAYNKKTNYKYNKATNTYTEHNIHMEIQRMESTKKINNTIS